MKRLKNKRKAYFSFLKPAFEVLLQGVGGVRSVVNQVLLVPYTLFRLIFPKSLAKNESHPVSKFLRTQLEKKTIQRKLGLGMTGLVLLTNIVVKPTSALDMTHAPDAVLPLPEETVVTETIFAKPLEGRLCQGFHRWHPAIDICAPVGTPIHSIASGEVVEASYSRLGWGNTVVVKHNIKDNQYYSRYAHLDKILVKVGQMIEKEAVVGTIGMTGWTTGPHLHLELRLSNGQPLDPLEYLPTLNYQLAYK